MNLFELFGKISIDNTEANREIDETTGKAEASQSKMTSAFKTVGHAVGTFLTADKVVSFGKTCINAAADASAASSQFSQVFGDVEGQAASSLSAIADETGIVENRMKDSFTKIAAFAKTTGMDSNDALKLSERAMMAVADSAAFYDRSLEDTTESLQSFLKGNYENDSALGLSCTETTRNAAANELYGKSFNELSEAQKQLTLLQMVEDANKATGALGQAARESDTWTNETGNLKQAFQDFAGIVGSVLLPVAVKVVGALADAVKWMNENKVVVGILAGVIGAITVAIIAYNAVKAVQNAMQVAEVATLWQLVAAQTAALAPYLLIAAAIAALIAVIVVCVKHWDKIKEAALNAWNFICNAWNSVTSWFSTNVLEPIKKIFSDAWQAVCDAFKGALDLGKRIVEDIKEGIRQAWQGLCDWFGGLWDSLFGNRKAKVEVEGTASGSKVNGSHANGLDYVPFDGYTAELHRGESVLTANEASIWRANRSDSNVVHQNDETAYLLRRIADLIQRGNDTRYDDMANAFRSMKFEVNRREFARMVRDEERAMGRSFTNW